MSVKTSPQGLSRELHKAFIGLVAVVFVLSLAAIWFTFQLHSTTAATSSALQRLSELSNVRSTLESFVIVDEREMTGPTALQELQTQFQRESATFLAAVVKLDASLPKVASIQTLKKNFNHYSSTRTEFLRASEQKLKHSHILQDTKVSYATEYRKLSESLDQSLSDVESAISKKSAVDSTALQDFKESISMIEMFPDSEAHKKTVDKLWVVYDTLTRLNLSSADTTGKIQKKFSSVYLAYSQFRRQLYDVSSVERQKEEELDVFTQSLLKDLHQQRLRNLSDLASIEVFIRENLLLATRHQQQQLANYTLFLLTPLSLIAVVFAVFLRNRTLRKLQAEHRSEAASRKKASEAEADAQKMVKMANAGEMAGKIAHEVLNPMTAASIRTENCKARTIDLDELFKVYTVLLNKGTSGTPEDIPRVFAGFTKLQQKFEDFQSETAADLAFVLSQMQRIIQETDRLRESTKQTRELEVLNFRDILTDLQSEMRDKLHEYQIALDVSYGSDEDLHMTAAYSEVYAVISNLLRNAMHAVNTKQGTGGKYIKIYTMVRNTKILYIEVSDNGIGIDEDKFEEIFESSYTSKGRSGTGIGLAYSRQLARSYNGDIKVGKSTKNKGTIFQLWFERDYTSKGEL